MTRFVVDGDMTRESAMRSPFDTDESSWWAVHGASSSKLPVAQAVELDPPFEPTEYVSSIEEDARVDSAWTSEHDPEAYAPLTPDELEFQEQLAAQERETVATSRSFARPLRWRASRPSDRLARRRRHPRCRVGRARAPTTQRRHGFEHAP